jgi:hypothetical protein
VVDLFSSSHEEDPIPDTSHDFEFTQHLYGELNRSLLGPPDDGKIIILNDSDKEKEEVHEEKSTGVEDAATSATVNLASTASTDDAVAPVRAKMIMVMIKGLIKRLAVGMMEEMMPVSLRLPRQ